ncbi:MAG: methyltransferase domain-containing protein [Patescibacteria group bacterium]
MRENFAQGGRKYWEGFGKSIELAPRQYFDFVGQEKYQEVFKNFDLEGKNVIDLGAGYPVLPNENNGPLVSQLHEVIESKGAKLVPVDVAVDPMEYQREIGRSPILADSFKLPFKDESIDGGVIMMNLLNSSYKGDYGKEIFISINECEKILKEAYRILQPDKFVLINNYGYSVAKMDGLVKFFGPDDDEINTPGMLSEVAKKLGFKMVENIEFDKMREELSGQYLLESFPRFLRDRIKVELIGGGALFFRK